jgi:hypothetical protein
MARPCPTFTSALMRRLFVCRALLAALLVAMGLGVPHDAPARALVEYSEPGAQAAARTAPAAVVLLVGGEAEAAPPHRPVVWKFPAARLPPDAIRHAYEATGPPAHGIA